MRGVNSEVMNDGNEWKAETYSYEPKWDNCRIMKISEVCNWSLDFGELLTVNGLFEHWLRFCRLKSHIVYYNNKNNNYVYCHNIVYNTAIKSLR